MKHVSTPGVYRSVAQGTWRPGTEELVETIISHGTMDSDKSQCLLHASPPVSVASTGPAVDEHVMAVSR